MLPYDTPKLTLSDIVAGIRQVWQFRKVDTIATAGAAGALGVTGAVSDTLPLALTLIALVVVNGVRIIWKQIAGAREARGFEAWFETQTFTWAGDDPADV